MKCERDNTFIPVVITLESEGELALMHNLIGQLDRTTCSRFDCETFALSLYTSLDAIVDHEDPRYSFLTL